MSAAGRQRPRERRRHARRPQQAEQLGVHRWSRHQAFTSERRAHGVGRQLIPADVHGPIREMKAYFTYRSAAPR